jgi:two-component system response regulator ChvI
LLADRAGENIAYREIYDVVHGKGFMAGEGPNGYRINVRSLIRKVRNRFRGIDKNFSEIENFAGYGYRWRSSNTESGASAGKINEKALMNPDLMNIAS